MSAHDIFQTMVTKMFQVLDAAGVAPADRHRVLTLASITQKEGGTGGGLPQGGQGVGQPDRARA